MTLTSAAAGQSERDAIRVGNFFVMISTSYAVVTVLLTSREVSRIPRQ
jgi:hypothetical protein